MGDIFSGKLSWDADSPWSCENICLILPLISGAVETHQQCLAGLPFWNVDEFYRYVEVVCCEADEVSRWGLKKETAYVHLPQESLLIIIPPEDSHSLLTKSCFSPHAH